ncbi:MAG: RNA polymerase sigma factor [Balneolaceae bacterium]|nr:RNA polymerase sigma factor [Balneolaceae bacterium]
MNSPATMAKQLKELSDAKLVQLSIGNGDQKAFGLLYDRYGDRVFNKCIAFTKSELDAEDLAHDIFLKVFLKLSTFNQKSSFYTWLYAITYNTCVDYARKQSNKNSQSISFEEIDQKRIKAYHSNSEQHLLKMKVDQLKQVLTQLPPQDKMILLMKYQEGLSIVELQEVFNIGKSAVKMRLLRARERAVTVHKELFN